MNPKKIVNFDHVSLAQPHTMATQAPIWITLIQQLLNANSIGTELPGFDGIDPLDLTRIGDVNRHVRESVVAMFADIYASHTHDPEGSAAYLLTSQGNQFGTLLDQFQDKIVESFVGSESYFPDSTSQLDALTGDLLIAFLNDPRAKKLKKDGTMLGIAVLTTGEIVLALSGDDAKTTPYREILKSLSGARSVRFLSDTLHPAIRPAFAPRMGIKVQLTNGQECVEPKIVSAALSRGAKVISQRVVWLGEVPKPRYSFDKMRKFTDTNLGSGRSTSEAYSDGSPRSLEFDGSPVLFASTGMSPYHNGRRSNGDEAGQSPFRDTTLLTDLIRRHAQAPCIACACSRHTFESHYQKKAEWSAPVVRKNDSPVFPAGWPTPSDLLAYAAPPQFPSDPI